MSAPVLVTGSTGFIGAAVTAALLRAGHAVRAGSRQVRKDTAQVACDLDNPADIAAAVAGAGAVVHCAYGDESAMPRQCAALLTAMSGAGVEVLVYFSSIAVYGDQGSNGKTRIDIDTLPDTYSRAKAECESLVRTWESGGEGRRAIILRPGIVYGKGSRFWIDKPVERIRAGMWGDFGPLANGFAALVHVDDVARVVVAALECATRSDAQSWPMPPVDVIGPETPTWNGYFQALAEAMGAPPLERIGPARLALWRLLAVPAKIWRRAGLPGGRRAALAPGHGELRLLGRVATYDTETIRRIPGAAPSTGLQQGLALTFAGHDTRPAP